MSDAPLVVVGDYAWDVLIRTNRPLQTGGDTFGEVLLQPGGSAANSAVWARRCGVGTSFVGKIGRDRLGDLAEEELDAEGVAHWLVRSEAHLTGSVAVWIEPTGERSMVSGKGADHHLMASELPRATLKAARHVHLTAWSFFANPPRAAAREAARVAKAAGATVSFDPGSFQMIRQTGLERFLRVTTDLELDVLFPNYEEGQVLTGEDEPERIVAALSALYPGARIVLKLDAAGALVQDDHGGTKRVPPATDDVLDATGAGDAFAGAYLARTLQGDDALEASRVATQVSAWVIQHLGARPMPDARLRKLIGPGPGAPA